VYLGSFEADCTGNLTLQKHGTGSLDQSLGIAWESANVAIVQPWSCNVGSSHNDDGGLPSGLQHYHCVTCRSYLDWPRDLNAAPRMQAHPSQGWHGHPVQPACRTPTKHKWEEQLRTARVETLDVVKTMSFSSPVHFVK